ncbi:MAG: type transport system permease protein [Solirubrobacteraceae bacterium]|nr:type transport system permease protein [Solirubrobacteraceae bacterium]
MNAAPTRRALAAAFLVRDWRIARTYRSALVLDAAATVSSFAVTYFLARAFAGAHILQRPELSHGYFPFASVGLLMLYVIESCVSGPTERLREDQQSGTLEMLASTPVAPRRLLFGGAGYRLTRALVNAAVGLAVAIALFGLRPTITIAGLLAVGIALAGGVIVAMAIGTVIAAAALTIRRTGVLTTAANTAIALSAGLYYPIAVLPDGLRQPAQLSPVTWSVDLMRGGLLNGRLDGLRAAGLLVSGPVLLGLATVLFERAFIAARRNGDLNRV